MIDFFKQFAEGAAVAQGISIKGQFDRVICCGMGGSIIPAEMLSLLWLQRSDHVGGRSPDAEGSGLPELNLYLQRSHDLPFWSNPRCLVICTSWSGNTEETISSFQVAVNQSLPVVVIATGGKLAELARQHNAPLILLSNPELLPPRLGTGQMLSALLTLLNNSAIIKFQADSASLASQPLDTGFMGRLANKTPLIYSSYAWRYLARFWKILLNENAKIHAFNNYLPEAVHNEIAGFAENTERYFPLILLDREEAADDIHKLEKLSQFFSHKKIDHQVIELAGPNRLAKVIQNYRLALACSNALAAQLGRDPLDISTIEEFKQTDLT